MSAPTKLLAAAARRARSQRSAVIALPALALTGLPRAL